MTFDDGILKFYKIENSSAPGDKPVDKLVFIFEEHFHEESVGIQRYFTALSNKRRIERVVCIYQNPKLNTNQIVIDELGVQYAIVMVQHSADENNIKIERISLERIDEGYEFLKCH